jgi:hypothetical protein
MNIMPQWLRDQFRAFYLRRELESIDQNEAHYIEMKGKYQDEIDKGQARRAVVTRELRGISA